MHGEICFMTGRLERTHGAAPCDGRGPYAKRLERRSRAVARRGHLAASAHVDGVAAPGSSRSGSSRRRRSASHRRLDELGKHYLSGMHRRTPHRADHWHPLHDTFGADTPLSSPSSFCSRAAAHERRFTAGLPCNSRSKIRRNERCRKGRTVAPVGALS